MRAKAGFRTCAYGVVKECLYMIPREQVQYYRRYVVCPECLKYLKS